MAKYDLSQLTRHERESFFSMVSTANELGMEVPRAVRQPVRHHLPALRARQNEIDPLDQQSIAALPDNMLEADHRIPIAKGGGNEPENLQATKILNNRRKGAAVDAVELIEYHAARYGLGR